MKKTYSMSALSVAIVLSIVLTGCQRKTLDTATARSSKEWMVPSDKVKVLSTTKMIDDLVQMIGGEHVIHVSLITGQLDPHSYELVKGDDEKISHADAVFYNGLDLEHGLSLKKKLTEHKHGVSLGEKLMEQSDVSLVVVNGQVDPHIWMDVLLFSKTIDPIVEKLSYLAPQHAEDFKRNGEGLRMKMVQIHEGIKEKIRSIPKEKRFLVSTHDAFFYFSRSYLCDENEKDQFFDKFAAPEGFAPDVQMSSEDLKKIIEYVKSNEIDTIFPESNLSQDALKKIVNVLKNEGIDIHISKEVLYADAMGEEGSCADHYLKMIQHDADVIFGHLMKEEGDGSSL